MSYLALNSSAGLSPFANYSHQLCSMNSHESQLINTGFAIGAQVVGPLVGSALLASALNIASYVYSKFSFPFAAASTVPECSTCLTPVGSYTNTCHASVVTYSPGLPYEYQCELTTSCAKTHEVFPCQEATMAFSPGELLNLENFNGTLKRQSSREEKINDQLKNLLTTASTPEALKHEEAVIIGGLNAGDVISVSRDLKTTVISRQEWLKYNVGFRTFQRIAEASGGIMGHSLSHHSLNPLIEKMSAHILKAAESSEFIDIAFVVDTTMSMQLYIGEVKKNLVQFLQHLKKLKQYKGNSLRVGVLEFRDKDQAFVNRVNTDFTSDLDKVQKGINALQTSGGGDEPEAVLDALLAVKTKLFWRLGGMGFVILLGDAPAHPRTTNGRYDEEAVVAEYRRTKTQLVVYSIFGERET